MYFVWTGLAACFLGSVLLAVASARISSVTNTWLTALDVTVRSYLSRQTVVPVFEGMDEMHTRSLKLWRKLNIIGWVLLAAGSALQGVGAIVASNP